MSRWKQKKKGTERTKVLGVQTRERPEASPYAVLEVADAKQPFSCTERGRAGLSFDLAVVFGAFLHPDVSQVTVSYTACACVRQQKETDCCKQEGHCGFAKKRLES